MDNKEHKMNTIDVYLLAGAEELSLKFNDLASVYSDLYKDVYGIRPRHMALCACDYSDKASLAEALSHLERLMDGVSKQAEIEFAREEAARQLAIKDFEEAIQLNLQYGAGDRATAIEWICDQTKVKNEPGVHGWEHLEYRWNIPFGYIKKNLKEVA